MKSIIARVKKYLINKTTKIKSKQEIIDAYIASGSNPWSEGYHENKWEIINKAITDEEILKKFKYEEILDNYGIGIDERVIEYPWLLSHIQIGEGKFLDAGSTFNFKVILDHPVMDGKDIYIYTYYPESNNFLDKRISYIYGDLRELPFKDNFFDQVVCHSTLEHIDMDNSMYGYDLSHQQDYRSKSFEYLKVVSELERAVKPGGKILLSFPYGKFENHGFFQQFDTDMVNKIEEAFKLNCSYKKSFAKYELNGWRFTSQTDCDNAESYNPHTGKGKGNDNAAHSRAICFIEILKNK